MASLPPGNSGPFLTSFATNEHIRGLSNIIKHACMHSDMVAILDITNSAGSGVLGIGATRIIRDNAKVLVHCLLPALVSHSDCTRVLCEVIKHVKPRVSDSIIAELCSIVHIFHVMI